MIMSKRNIHEHPLGHPLGQGKMEVEQINLADEVRTGERDERVSRHAVLCRVGVGSTGAWF